MKRICIPLEIKVKVSDKKLKWAFKSEENFQSFTNELSDIKLEQNNHFFYYPHFYYLWR